jgi:hypothetical protein
MAEQPPANAPADSVALAKLRELEARLQSDSERFKEWGRAAPSAGLAWLPRWLLGGVLISAAVFLLAAAWWVTAVGYRQLDPADVQTSVTIDVGGTCPPGQRCIPRTRGEFRGEATEVSREVDRFVREVYGRVAPPTPTSRP